MSAGELGFLVGAAVAVIVFGIVGSPDLLLGAGMALATGVLCGAAIGYRRKRAAYRP